jgi:flagellar hook-length control protein FliK
MAIAASDAGAESAVQRNANAPSDAGAIFESLMIAAGEPTPDLAVTADAGLPINTTAPILNETVAISNETQALASDMEQMVQALAITAEVVAQGMAARTTPIREIILTVETPSSDTSDMALPQLSIVVPAMPAPSQPLKISDADPATNLDPVLVAMMPQLPQTQNTATQVDVCEFTSIKPITATTEDVEDVAALAEKSAAQPSPVMFEESYGPWRAEIHGPFLNPQHVLVTRPVHVAVFDAPEPIVLPVVTSELVTSPEMLPSQPSSTQVVASISMADMPVRVVTIHVPMKTDDQSETDTVESLVTSVTETETEQKASVFSDPMQPTDTNVKPADFIGPQMIQSVTKAIESPALDQAEESETVEDALHGPRPIQTEAHVILVSKALPEVAKTTASASTPTVTAAPINQAVPSTETKHQVGAFDVAAVVVTLHKDADLTRLAHRQVVDTRHYETLLDTNISNPVSKTSSRSSSDIRELMKLGVRDIEITQGTGSAQDMNVRPQPQINEPTGAAAATRAQVADAFVPSGNEAGTTERRAQAHEIRMRAIERQVVAAVRDGTDTIRMQLYPPGLGQIIIRLTMDGSKLKLTTSANSSDAADSLRSIEGDLRDALSFGGLELTGFDVSEDGEGGEKNRKHASETENNNQQSRSAKSEDFALDMNA